MKTLSCLTAIAVLLASAPASPSETPRPTAQDNRIREVIYSDTQVFRIVGVFRSATQIVFSPGERVEHVALVRRQNIRHNSRRRLAECGPRQGVDVRRRTCGAASADVRWSVA